VPGPTFTFIQMMTPSGDGSGNVNMNGNFSPGAPGFFFVECPPGFGIVIQNINIIIVDDGDFSIDGFGKASAALINGIEIEQRFNGVVRLPLSGFRFRRNYEWLAAAQFDIDVSLKDFWGSGRALAIRSNFAPDFGATIERRPTDYLGIRLRDNLTFLTAMIASVRGTIAPL